MRVLSMALGHAYAPPDSWSFRAVADQLGHWDFHAYEGARPPVFPLLILLSGRSDGALWVLHSLLGCVSATILARVTYDETRNEPAAFAVGAVLGLGFYPLAFEASVMSETVALTLLSVSLLLTWKQLNGFSTVAGAVLLGATTGLLALTRPMFLYLIVVYAFALRRHGTRHLFAFVGTSSALVLGWSLFNWFAIDYFGPTTLLGFNLTNHCGAFIERAPPEFSDLRDIYLRHRERRMASFGTHTQTIWDALPEMLQATGLSYPALSKRCLAMSVALIEGSPGLYLASVARAYGRFWLAPNCRGFDWLPPRGPFLARVWDVQEAFFIASKVTLHALAPLVFWRRLASSFARVVVAVVMAGAVFQALLEFGENDRYSVPLQPWAACGAVLLVVGFVRRKANR